MYAHSLVLVAKAAKDAPSDHVAGGVDDCEGHHAGPALRVSSDLREGLARLNSATLAPALVVAQTAVADASNGVDSLVVLLNLLVVWIEILSI